MKIVLCNAVGVDSDGFFMVHSPTRWSFSMRGYDDVFCYYPWEMAHASTLLKARTRHRVKMIDPCLEHWNGEETATRVAAERPDLLLIEPSTRTWAEDITMALEVKRRTGCRIVVAGQHATAFPAEVARVADHVLIGEYEEALLDLVEGRRDAPGIWPSGRRGLVDYAGLPWPEDDDVSRYAYAVPGEPNCEYREIQFYTSRGCPMECAFCAAVTVYYGRPNWRPRPAVDVVDEMEHLLRRYPEAEGFFIDEEEHNSNAKRLREIAAEIRRRGLTPKIDAMSLYACFDRETLEILRDAGWYKIRVGVETASEKIAQGMNLGRKFDLERLHKVLGWAKDLGIHMYGTFSVGGPGSTREEDLKTAALIREITAGGLMRDIQISINTPQPGTPFYLRAKEEGWLLHENWPLYDGGNRAVVSYPDYPAEEIERTFRDCLSAYDDGLAVREGPRVRAEAAAFFGGLGAQRAIVFRSTRPWHTRAVVEGFFDAAPDGRCDVLCQARVAGMVRDVLAGRGEAIVYGDGHLAETTIGDGRLLELRARRYHMAVACWNNTTGRGFENVHRIARFVAPGRAVAVGWDGRGRLLPEAVAA